MEKLDINLVALGPLHSPRWIIMAGEEWFWTGDMFVLNRNAAMLFAHGSLAESHLRMLRNGLHPTIDGDLS